MKKKISVMALKGQRNSMKGNPGVRGGMGKRGTPEQKISNYISVPSVDEGQKVITTGPYAIVRHPMYLGVLLMYLFTPLALGSYWALIFFLPLLPLLAARLLNEEEVLLRGSPDNKLNPR